MIYTKENYIKNIHQFLKNVVIKMDLHSNYNTKLEIKYFLFLIIKVILFFITSLIEYFAL